MKFLVIFVIFISYVMSVYANETTGKLLKSNLSKYEKINRYDPFKRVKPLVEKKKIKRVRSVSKKKLELIAVMNKKAFIDNRWFKEGDYIRGAKITKITQQRVYLKTSKRITVLHINKEKNMLRIKQKDKQ